MLGIDLLKECFVNGNNNYLRVVFIDKDKNKYCLFYNCEIPIVLKNGKNLFSDNLDFIDFLNNELEKEKQEEMAWSECITAWAKNPIKYYIKIIKDLDHNAYIYGMNNECFLEEKDTGYGISDELINEGIWYLCEKN